VAAAVEELHESSAALKALDDKMDAALRRVEAALRELREASDMAHGLLHPAPSIYN
jgi:hypothetical protein